MAHHGHEARLGPFARQRLVSGFCQTLFSDDSVGNIAQIADENLAILGHGLGYG